jgi:hypothetical protein
MAYIPINAKWYVGELIEQITVEGDPRSVVHKNLILIRADSPEQAYEKAVALGHEAEDSYENPAGKKVRTVFRGLGELNVIHDDLDHGTELLYEEHIGVTNEEIEKWVQAKNELTIFRPTGPLKSPDYRVREVVEDAVRFHNDS